MSTPSNLGHIVLAIFLILYGAILLLKLSFQYSNEVTGILAIAAGVLLLLRK
jgi:hypothetical protein